MTSVYGITRDGTKQTGRDARVKPDVVVHDVALTRDLPITLTVQSLLNAFAHVASTGEGLDAAATVLRAIEDLLLAPTDPNARAYVPTNPNVLQATKLLQQGQLEQLNFTAPAKPGEYSFLCTFPGHWVRMYGVMLVVPSLDQFETKPTPPTDPVSGKPFESQRQPASK